MASSGLSLIRKLAEWRTSKAGDGSAGRKIKSEEILDQWTNNEMDSDFPNKNLEAGELDIGALVQVRRECSIQTAVLETLPDQGPVKVRIFGSKSVISVEREDLLPCTINTQFSREFSGNHVQLIAAEETNEGDVCNPEDDPLIIDDGNRTKIDLDHEMYQVEPASKPVVVLERLSSKIIRKYFDSGSVFSINETWNLSGSRGRERELICEGDLVWARLQGYPHWPAVVMNRKGRGKMCRKTIKGVRKVSVIFLGEKKQTAWLPETAVVQFTDRNQFTSEKLKSSKGKSEWESAVQDAEEMFTCDIPCRMFYFS